VIWLVSLMDKSAQAVKERAAYPAQLIRSETGVGASTGGIRPLSSSSTAAQKRPPATGAVFFVCQP
jgi:hypothetical protein